MGSSPHARGKLVWVCCRSFRVRLIPACAGKTAMSLSRLLRARAHPRMRGENKLEASVPFQLWGSSPHARGKRCGISTGFLPAGLIPACAGKTAMRRDSPQRRWAHPRMRGENTLTEASTTAGLGSSPHARGKRQRPRLRGRRHRLIPACAGKTALAQFFAIRPRGSSPHARGKLSKARGTTSITRLIPACAGKTPAQANSILWSAAHPRMRGENSR